MSVRRLSSIIIAALWLWPAGLHAQPEAWMTAYQRGDTLYQAGRYGEAIPYLERALELAEREYGPAHALTARSLKNLAEAHRARGGYAEAEPFYRRALAVWEKALRPEHPALARILRNYAGLLRKTGRVDEARRMEACARMIRVKHGFSGYFYPRDFGLCRSKPAFINLRGATLLIAPDS